MKIYIVKYSTGNYDDYCENEIFVTQNERKAKKYVGKFRKILKKWKLYYSQFEGGKISSIKWIKDEHVDKHFNRWNSINNINNCWYKEIEVR